MQVKKGVALITGGTGGHDPNVAGVDEWEMGAAWNLEIDEDAYRV